MSYGFGMLFKANLKSLGDAMTFAHEFVQRNKTPENIKNTLKDNSFFIPSLRYGSLDDPDYIKGKFRIMDQYWMDRLFTYDFVYWPEYQLLSLVGEEYPNKDMFDRFVYFQNSGGRDYDFEEWNGIPIAQKIAKKYALLTRKGICLEMLPEKQQKRGSRFCDQIRLLFCRPKTIDLDDFDTAQDRIEYENKVSAYDEIYETLKLDTWLWDGSDPAFKRFSLCMFNSHDETMNAYYDYLYRDK